MVLVGPSVMLVVMVVLVMVLVKVVNVLVMLVVVVVVEVRVLVVSSTLRPVKSCHCNVVSFHICHSLSTSCGNFAWAPHFD